MTSTSNTGRSYEIVIVSVWSLLLLAGYFRSSTATASLAVTSPEAAAGRRPDRQHQPHRQPLMQHRRQRRGWSTTTALPRGRQPAPLDCSEGLERCREERRCRALLETLDHVCDRSSTLIQIYTPPECAEIFTELK